MRQGRESVQFGELARSDNTASTTLITQMI